MFQALLCHGLDDDDMALVQPHDRGADLQRNAPLQALLARGDLRFVLNGHSHRQMVRRIDGLTIVNAGTLHSGHNPCYVLVDFVAGDGSSSLEVSTIVTAVAAALVACSLLAWIGDRMGMKV